MKYLFFTLFVLSLVCFSACSAKGQQDSLLSPKEFQEKAQNNTQLIDVRSPEEYASGHLANFQNVNIAAVGFKEKMAELEKDKPVFVYCAVGGRSALAASTLYEMGFTEIYELKGGIKAWMSEGLETQR